MSVGTPIQENALQHEENERLPVAGSQHEFQDSEFHIHRVVERIQKRIAPVWPLKDYVAVNPYAGFAEHKFLEARQMLRRVSDLETLMPPEYFRQEFIEGNINEDVIRAAIEELVADGVLDAETIDTNQTVEWLHKQSALMTDANSDRSNSQSTTRQYQMLSESLDQTSGTEWTEFIREETSKHCADHFDEGQSAWSNPWKALPLYQSWRLAAEVDYTPEVIGITGFRRFVSRLPHDPLAALNLLLDRLDIPNQLVDDYLLCTAFQLPGWSAWASFKDREANKCGHEKHELAGHLAIQLAYNSALSECFNFNVKWGRDYVDLASEKRESGEIDLDDDTLHRLVLLRASELAYRRQLLGGLSKESSRTNENHCAHRSLAQMVFCIDVRSERIRRHLEASSSCDIETLGFAGFFGLPIEFVSLGESEGTPHVPVLISPQFKVQQEVKGDDGTTTRSAIKRKTFGQFLRKTWKEFQTSPASCFSFVESTGLFYGIQLVAQSIGWGKTITDLIDETADGRRQSLAPTLRGLHRQGITTSKQVDLAESILRGIGIVENFGRLVVFCGHSSETRNNPLKAGLDCGACGGHSGEPNARLAAQLLNQQSVRQSLQDRGIRIPDDTWFVGALHNTTTDKLEFFESEEFPESHRNDFLELEKVATVASQKTRIERLPLLPGTSTDDLYRRSRDWAEVRPEWGLAGNAAFVAAPRSYTEAVSLDGRVFLHSYDFTKDAEFAVLEQIMTAPLIVAHWINMQYYASTVDPVHMGSGTKTIHNVVGQIGILSGNGGDLRTGLPWQSVHDGASFRHHPLRLLAVIAAPRNAIESIINRHEALTNLLSNGWMQLVSVEDGEQFRFTETGDWAKIEEQMYTATTN